MADIARFTERIPQRWFAVVAYQPWLKGERWADFGRHSGDEAGPEPQFRCGANAPSRNDVTGLRSFGGVDAAFRLGFAAPAAGAGVFAGRGAARARHASDRQVP